jgi:four helix bundle protein
MDLYKFNLIQLADTVSEQIWNEVHSWKMFERDTLGKQLVRAADSISANLSEAYGRYTYPDRRRFTYYARGSLCETTNWLDKAIRRKLITEEAGNELLAELTNLSFKINYYIKSLAKQTSEKD